MSAPPESVGGIYLQAMPYSIARRADILRIGFGRRPFLEGTRLTRLVALGLKLFSGVHIRC